MAKITTFSKSDGGTAGGSSELPQWSCVWVVRFGSMKVKSDLVKASQALPECILIHLGVFCSS